MNGSKILMQTCGSKREKFSCSWIIALLTRIEFLSANTTSKLQSMDQGIIKVFKGFYRTEVVRKLLDCIEEGREVRASIHFYETMLMIHKAWNNITSATIRNCFKKARFVKKTDKKTLSKRMEI